MHVPDDPFRTNLFLEIELNEGAKLKKKKKKSIKRIANCGLKGTAFSFSICNWWVNGDLGKNLETLTIRVSLTIKFAFYLQRDLYPGSSV